MQYCDLYYSYCLDNYYSQDNRYERINTDYPRFITDDNSIDIDEEVSEYVEGEGEDEVFTGDIFENFNKS